MFGSRAAASRRCDRLRGPAAPQPGGRVELLLPVEDRSAAPRSIVDVHRALPGRRHLRLGARARRALRAAPTGVPAACMPSSLLSRRARRTSSARTTRRAAHGGGRPRVELVPARGLPLRARRRVGAVRRDPRTGPPQRRGWARSRCCGHGPVARALDAVRTFVGVLRADRRRRRASPLAPARCATPPTATRWSPRSQARGPRRCGSSTGARRPTTARWPSSTPRRCERRLRARHGRRQRPAHAAARRGRLADCGLAAAGRGARHARRSSPATTRRPGIKALRKERAQSWLGELDWFDADAGPLAAIGGSVRNIAAAAQRLHELPNGGVQGFSLTTEMVGGRRRAELAGRSGRGAPARSPGINPDRGDVILAAAVVLETILSERRLRARSRSPRRACARGIFFERYYDGREPPVARRRRPCLGAEPACCATSTDVGARAARGAATRWRIYDGLAEAEAIEAVARGPAPAGGRRAPARHRPRRRPTTTATSTPAT